ncbi:MAG: DUF3788 family protein [Ignavibacteriales bacterium]|nr:MAG: DUF3788 family protein [Ignavibacteriales bacterium]
MEEKSFIEKNIKPDEAGLKKALGKTFSFYEKIIKQVSSFKSDWSFYNKSGWLLKIYDSKKALLYFVPLKNEFMISMTIRENERTVFMKDDELSFFHEEMNTSKKYPEGYALRFIIKTKTDYDNVSLFIQKLISMR